LSNREPGAGQTDVTPSSAVRRTFGWDLMILPSLLTLVVVFLLPIAHLFVNSLHTPRGDGQVGSEFTLANYWHFISDPFYLLILFDTVWLGFVVVTFCFLLGYPVAYVLARTKSRFRGALIFLVIAPLLISTVVRNLGWFPILGGGGLVNWVLTSLGLISDPLKLANNFTGVVITLVHSLLPFMILTLMSVIQRIEVELEEAAINLGASPLETFFRIVLRLSRPGLLSGYLLVLTIAISAFTTPAMMGGGRVLVMSILIAQQVRGLLNYAFGATAAVILVVVAVVLTLAAGHRRGEEA
jgi:putative spermidine/putrescine transport system permease protein